MTRVKAKIRFVKKCIDYLDDTTVQKFTEYQSPQSLENLLAGFEISSGIFFAVHLGREMSGVLSSLGVKEEVSKSIATK